MRFRTTVARAEAARAAADAEHEDELRLAAQLLRALRDAGYGAVLGQGEDTIADEQR